MQAFVIMNKFGIKISPDVNVNNWLTKVDVIMDLFEILVSFNVKVSDIWYKSCNIRDYLYHENCKCRKKLTDKLFEECRENIDQS